MGALACIDDGEAQYAALLEAGETEAAAAMLAKARTERGKKPGRKGKSKGLLQSKVEANESVRMRAPMGLLEKCERLGLNTRDLLQNEELLNFVATEAHTLRDNKVKLGHYDPYCSMGDSTEHGVLQEPDRPLRTAKSR